jgi:hypothetical protein
MDFYNHQVILELITGWVLGKGPCGPSCSKVDIGRSTKSTRATIISSDSHSLGTFALEYKKSDKATNKTEINTRVNSFYNETVIAISETGKWEQEIMHFSVIMESDKQEIDIRYVKRNKMNRCLIY